MTDPWTDPADALFTNPDWEDPFPYEEGWPVELAGPEYLMAVYASYGAKQVPPFGAWVDDDFYAPRARWVSDR